MRGLMLTPPPPRSRSFRSAGSRAAPGTSARPAAFASCGEAASTSRSTSRPTRAPPTEKPSLRNDPCTASPCGSRIPSFGLTRTVTLTEHDLRVGEVVVERKPRQQLERLDVTGACAGDDVRWDLGARVGLVPAQALGSSRARTACRTTAAGRRVRSRPRARSGRSPASAPRLRARACRRGRPRARTSCLRG